MQVWVRLPKGSASEDALVMLLLLLLLLLHLFLLLLLLLLLVDANDVHALAAASTDVRLRS